MTKVQNSAVQTNVQQTAKNQDSLNAENLEKVLSGLVGEVETKKGKSPNSSELYVFKGEFWEQCKQNKMETKAKSIFRNALRKRSERAFQDCYNATLHLRDKKITVEQFREVVKVANLLLGDEFKNKISKGMKWTNFRDDIKNESDKQLFIKWVTSVEKVLSVIF